MNGCCLVNDCCLLLIEIAASQDRLVDGMRLEVAAKLKSCIPRLVYGMLFD